ncbi:VOC family protein [Leptolyngbya sp. 7M]|uniref:VOC family protein n=1 Tax=Leptolyngbya sp. 7M TaxID=2812896 RepID=UPI0028F442D1|nr:VOC family protein [Leptolyngbya sp. 7M]
MQKITPFLWFDGEAEEAANFYVAIFPNSTIGTVTRYDEATAVNAGRPVGSALTVDFILNGQQFVGLNGGPLFKFTEAVSFAIQCKDQAEIDHYWEKLTADGGEESMCGRLSNDHKTTAANISRLRINNSKGKSNSDSCVNGVTALSKNIEAYL